MKKRWILLLLCSAMLCSLLPATVRASSEVPYLTHTFDKWGNGTPAPNGYMPTRNIGGGQLGCGNFRAAADMFYNEALKEIYIVDAGNNRIVVLSEDLELLRELQGLAREDGEPYTFNNPQGIYVCDDGTLYVADTANAQVVKGTSDGRFVEILPAPQSNLLPENFNYRPTKVITDEQGRIYVLSVGTYQGLIYLDAEGNFIKFFGPNEVEMTLRRQVQKLWKSILSEEAAATMQSFNPIEYGNVFMAHDGFIYATAAGSENGSALVTKLNPLGIDCLPYKIKISAGLISDITVDENGIITLLDTNNGRLYQFNESGSTMFTFGGIGNQTGLFRRAVSVIEVNDRLYVLDADKNMITEFELSYFGDLVRKAVLLYDAGLYEESIEPWREVVRHDANYVLAYTGMGKAYYQLKDYNTAMYYFKLANDRANYSEAFREATLIWIRSSFTYIVLGAAALAVVIPALARTIRKEKMKRRQGL